MTRDEAALVVLNRVLDAEGGTGIVPGESFVTRFGQTPEWLAQFGFPIPGTRADAMQNYQTWLVRTGLIAICDEPDTLAWTVIDWATNAGHHVAIRALQKLLRVEVDGTIGPETRSAILQCDRLAIAVRLMAARVRWRGALIASNPAKFGQYAKGWAARDAAQIEALA